MNGDFVFTAQDNFIRMQV